MPRPSAIPDRVREQYETYPFPMVTRVYEEDPERDLRASYNFDFGLRGTRALKPGARLWIAGASTRWAVLAALQFRDVKVVASDFSERSLEFQSSLARSLGLDNLEFRCEDLTKTRYQREFRYVSCVGVLHHLADPGAGLRVLADALEPGGILELMLYDPINRRLGRRMQHMLELLLPPDASADDRLSTACEILKTLSPTLFAADHPLRRLARQVGDASPAELSDLADVLSQPHEVAYQVPEVLALLESKQLRLNRWKNPGLFEPEWMLDDPALIKQIRALPDAQRWHVCQLIANPLLELFAETRGPRSAKIEFSSLRVRACAHHIEHHIGSNGQVTRSVRRSRLKRERAGLRVRGLDREPCVSAYAFDNLLPPVAGEILELAKEPIVVDDLARIVAKKHRLARSSHRALVSLCEKLCRPPIRVLAVVE